MLNVLMFVLFILLMNITFRNIYLSRAVKDLINLSNNTDISKKVKQKQNNKFYQMGYDKTLSTFGLLTMWWIPASLFSMLNTLNIWFLPTWGKIATPDYITITAVITSLVIFNTIKTYKTPSWLLVWADTLESARDEIQLEFITNRISDIQDILKNKSNTLQPEEVMSLFAEATMLTHRARYITDLVERRNSKIMQLTK